MDPILIILDSELEIHLFCNRNLLENTRISEKGVVVHFNSGDNFTNKISTLKIFADMWLNPNGIANIPSLKEVINRHVVTYKSEEDRGGGGSQ